MNGTCGDCRHWGEAPDWDGQAREWGVCGRIKHGFWQARYRNGDYEPVPFVAISAPDACTMDGSDYQSHLDTNALFGCRLWEAKKP